MGNDNEQPVQNGTKLNLAAIITIIASLGAVGGGGGYLVNSGFDGMESQMAVMQVEIVNIKEAQKTISEKVFDEFKEHVNDPNLHLQGMQKLKKDIKDELREPMKKQWELISDLKDRVTKLEAWKESLETQ